MTVFFVYFESNQPIYPGILRDKLLRSINLEGQPFEQKIEADEYAIKNKSNYLAAEKYGVSERTIRYLRTEIDKLKKASKTKITIHKGPPISELKLNTDLKLLEFYEINRKLKKSISTYSLKIESLIFRPDLRELTPH